MNRRIRKVGIALIVCYLALFVQLNVVQVFRADELNAHPDNSRAVQREFNRPRGDIVSADGALLAESEEVDGKAFDVARRYPQGELFAHTTGYLSFLYGATGLERSYNAQLAGNTTTQQLQGLTELFVDRPNVGDLHLSLRKDLQELARDQLGERAGSVVAIDPRTGQLLAFWSYPSYDPNPLASIDLADDGSFATATAAWDLLNAAPGNPLLAHQYQERYFPGSTFKVVTAGVGLAQGTVTATEPRYPVERSWSPPLTDLAISNFGGSACGGDLFAILRVSCNTAFARMGVETIGPDAMVEGTARWGFNDRPPIDLPEPAASAFPTDFTRDLPRLAQASIGQNDVAATPLQMALVAAAVANGGEMMRPTVVDEVRSPTGEVIDRNEPEPWQQPLDPDDAEVLRQAMIGVVEGGTARMLRTPGIEVGGKTGTAQLGTEPPSNHTWMIAFAGPPGDPQVAVAVVVLDQAVSETGGEVAGPIAKAMIDAVLALRAAEGPARPPLAPVPAPESEPGQGGPATGSPPAPPAPAVTSSTTAPTAPPAPTTTASSPSAPSSSSTVSPSTTAEPTTTSSSAPAPPTTASTTSSSADP